MRTRALPIRTPEGIVFSQVLAGPATRFLAAFIDILCVSALGLALQKALGLLDAIDPNFASALLLLSYFGISIGYGILLEWRWRGQTVGKRLCRLRVVDAEGMRLQLD